MCPLATKLREQHADSKTRLSETTFPTISTNSSKQTQFEILCAKLLTEIRPEGTLEIETFYRYAFALFQLNTLRRVTTDLEENLLDNLAQYDCVQHIVAQTERRADRAIHELRKLQADRFAAQDVANEIYLLDRYAPIPATLPAAVLRRKFSPFQLAAQIITNEPDCQAILRGELVLEPRNLTNEANPYDVLP